jgi:Outer membrane efflux protein/Universal stress protein family
MTTMQANKRIGLKNILFLTDFSDSSAAAIPFATSIARAYGSVVHALHVLQPSPYTYMTPEVAATLLDDQEDQAKAEMQRVEAELSDALVSRRHDQYQQRETNQSISLDVTTAVHALEASKLGMEAAKVAVDLAKETLRADERKYELGTEQIFFVLDAQTQLAQAELNLIQSQVSFQLAVAQVDHATGDLLEHHHVQIVESAK